MDQAAGLGGVGGWAGGGNHEVGGANVFATSQRVIFVVFVLLKQTESK